MYLERRADFFARRRQRSRLNSTTELDENDACFERLAYGVTASQACQERHGSSTCSGAHGAIVQFNNASSHSPSEEHKDAGSTPAPSAEASLSKAVFTTKPDPAYDDRPEERYHFPATYLNQARAALNDWIVYYEPRRVSAEASSRGGRQAYFAAARVRDIARDPAREDHYYAYVDSYLELARPVPFREGARYYETSLKRADGGTSKGMFGRAVRVLADQEFEAILEAGFAPIVGEAKTAEEAAGVGEEPELFVRPIIERLVARPFRDAAFAVQVREAYGGACAMTDIKLVNGGGRTEAQAAHIRPVAAGGSDSIRNGLALSGTLHWMFDRGLVSVADDFSILVARDRVPDAMLGLLRNERRLRLPERAEAWPHAAYLRFHRENVFKG
jgi:putative restriction endonuclease